VTFLFDEKDVVITVENSEIKSITDGNGADLSAENELLCASIYLHEESGYQILAVETANFTWNFAIVDKEVFFALFSAYPTERRIDKFIFSTFLGTSSGVASEIAYRTGAERMCDTTAQRLFKEFQAWFSAVAENRFTPIFVADANGAPLDYFYAPVSFYGDAATYTEHPSFLSLLDSFFGARDLAERMSQRAADISHLLTRSVNRLTRKLELQREEYRVAEGGELYRRYGDMITANLYRLTRGTTELIATDYEADPPCEVKVSLDGRLSPSANAQRMYKLYTKSKKAKEVLTEQIASAELELSYLDSVSAFLERAESEADLAEIRDELYHAGYATRMKNYTPPKKIKLRPTEYVTAGGYRVLCGRNNIENDNLTFSVAKKGDLWFHAKGVPGSHVLLLCDGEEPSAEDYTAVAEIAAYHSQANTASVAVDYTRVKNVKKPPAAKPGYVTYKTNYTAFVQPNKHEEMKV
jgi:predicted ribosome quality control (RQC) complex YloA/Tae2 family protein